MSNVFLKFMSHAKRSLKKKCFFYLLKCTFFFYLQTLYEVERERDMERLEGKRKIEQLKRTVTQDHHDTKSKVQEVRH